MNFLRYFIFIGIISGFSALQAQWVTHRLDLPSNTINALRTFPCQGIVRYEEHFDGLVLPQDWSVLDLDNADLNPNLNYLQKGWQPILDFKDSTNTAMASPSWYQTPDTCEDWLITKKITLGENTCVSWYAYSQDIYYPERYEVRISTTTSDTAAFFDNPVVRTVPSEFYSENYRSANLKTYKNKEIYLAFRHRSYDKFVLVLDNLKLADVLARDLAMFSVNTPLYADTAQTVTFKGAVINYGSDTLSLDSGVFKIHYKLNNGTTESSTFKKTYKLAPNDTLNWTHDSTWTTPKNYSVFNLTTWFTGLSNQPTNNDTLSLQFGIYPTSISNFLPPTVVRLFPNPAQDELNLALNEALEIQTITCIDLQGRKIHLPIASNSTGYQANTSNLSKGLYYLQIETQNGKYWSGKFWKE